jgi:hypothetical protein
MRMTVSVARSMTAVVATAGILAAGAWAGGAFRNAGAEAAPKPGLHAAKHAEASPSQPYPRRAEPGEIRIGDALTVNGQRIWLSAFTTSDRAEAVVEFYAEAFRRRGLIPIAATRDLAGHVSVFDPQDGLQYFVTTIPERSGRTVVLLGATDPRAFTLSRSAASAPYPIPDRRRAFVAYESEDGRVRGHSGQFVSTLSAKEIAEFYRVRLAARGFVERPESAPGLLAFVNGPEQISVAMQSLEHEHGAAVFVTRTEGQP